LTKEEELYYESYFDLFIHPGWKQFISDIQDSISIYRIEDIKDESHLKTVQGNLQTLQRIAAFEDSIRNAYDQNVEADNAEAI
jgi:hypothetical protein